MTNATSPRGGTLLLVLLATCGAPNAVPDDPRWLNFAAAKGPGRGKHVVLIAAEQEYRSEQSMPMLAKILAQRHGFACTVLFAQKNGLVDPTQKIYTEVDTIGIAGAIGTSNISVTNLLSSVTKLDDTKVIAGIPTDHYRLTISYDITITYRTMPLKQSVRCTRS